MDIRRLKEEFSSIFGEADGARCFFAPGRVNLIGEHTDYNGGYVLPCALHFGTFGAVRKRADGLMRFASASFDKVVECPAERIAYRAENGWANYLIGVADQFVKRGCEISGLECYISGEIPSGAGLSSSASIELLMAVALNSLFGCGLGMLELVKLSQECENTFVGLNCGIMDQFAVGFGRRGHALMLHCNTLVCEYVPVPLEGHALVLADSNKRRSLAASKYNERRQECERAVNMLQAAAPGLTFLAELDAARFQECRRAIDDPVVLKRAEHVVYENERVLHAVACLKAKDLAAFGALMNESHESLRDKFEVTGFELDALAGAAWGAPGVLGSRMTGAGFGGCTVSVVRNDALERFVAVAGERYKAETGLTADFYVAETGSGARELTEEKL